MINSHRKTSQKILDRALDKCTRFYRNGLHAYCTPVEYLVLCWYFRINPQDYYVGLVKTGCCNPSNHYFKMKKFDRVYPENKYAMLDVNME